jgi:hypothetical protein
MAEIATLALRVVGTGIAETQAQIEALGNSSLTAGERIQAGLSTGAKAFAPLAAMADQQRELTRRINDTATALGFVTPEAHKAAAALQFHAAATETLSGGTRVLHTAIRGLSSELGIMGPAGAIASGVLTEMSIGGLAAAGPIAIVATAIGALIFAITQGTTAEKHFAETTDLIRTTMEHTADIMQKVRDNLAATGAGVFEKMALSSRVAADTIEKDFTKIASDMRAKAVELKSGLAGYGFYADIENANRLTAQSELVMSQAVRTGADVRKQATLEIADSLKTQLDALRAQRIATDSAAESISAGLHIEMSVQQSTNEVITQNTLLRNENRLRMALQTGASAELVTALWAEISVGREKIKLLDSEDRLMEAKSGGTAGAAIRGSISAMKEELTGLIEAGQFAGPLFDQLMGKVEGIQRAADIKFKFEIPPEVQGQIDSFRTLIERVAKANDVKLNLDADQPFRELGRIEGATILYDTEASKPITLQADASGVFSMIDSVSGAIDALRVKAAQPIIIKTVVEASGSPTMPFTEYFQNYMPGIAKSASAKISAALAPTVNMQGAAQGMLGFGDKIGAMLTSYYDLMGSVLNTGTGSKFGLDPTGNTLNQDANAAEAMKNRILMEAIAAGIVLPADFFKHFLAFPTSVDQVGLVNNNPLSVQASIQELMQNIRNAPVAGNGVPAGGGGTIINISIDLRNSTVSPATLDSTIIPALERAVLRTTGKTPNFRVLN